MHNITNEFIQTLLHANPVGCIAYMKKGDHLTTLGFSDALYEASGYDRFELKNYLNRDAFDIVNEQDQPWVRKLVLDSIDNGWPLDCTYRVMHKSGAALWVLCRGKVIGTLNGNPVIFVTMQNLSSAENQIILVNKVPTGLGIYNVTDHISMVFLNDGYYNMLGLDKSKRVEYLGDESMNVIHPADRDRVTNAIQQAIEGNGNFQTLARIIVEDNTYQWLQLDGQIVNRAKNCNTFYVAFTKIDQLIKMTNQLEASNTTLEAALSAAKQMCCEYDIRLKTLTGKTGASVQFGLPNRVENFPESLISLGIIYKDDEKQILDTIRALDEGSTEEYCELRLKHKGQYRWFSCNFKKYYDRNKQYEVAICNFSDCTLQKEALLSYQSHLDTVIRLNPDSISTFRMNITKNTCGNGVSPYWNILKLQEKGTVDDFFAEAERLMEDEEERKIYRSTFNRENLIKSFNEGKNIISVEHSYLLEDNHTEWIETVISLVNNPNTGDIEGILYTKNISSKCIDSIILNETLEKDYLEIALVQTSHNHYFTLDNNKKNYTANKDDFWQTGLWNMLTFSSDIDILMLHKTLTKEKVCKMLAKNSSYIQTFQGNSQFRRRYQIQFSYAQNHRKLIVVSVRDITDEALLEKLSYDSQHDALTGIYNRQKTYSECDKLLAAHPDEVFAIIHFDIQKFRLYNSFFGSKEGDNLLIYIADMFRGLYNTHKYGVYGRIEADVFFLCFPFSKEVIQWNENYIHNKLMQYRKDFLISGACGVYIDKTHELSAEEMFNRALVASKNNNQKQMRYVNFYDENMDKELKREQRITAEMRDSLNNNEFIVYLQPKYRTANGKPYGAEALVRWQHPAHGLVPPNDFIPLFEKNGFVASIDQYMWESVCKLLRKWIDEGKQPAPISVNVSRISMYSQETVPFLSNLMQKYDLSPSLLNLELTETAYMDNPGEMKERLLQLQKLGFQIMMDDFGSGYSSLNTLRELPFDYMKVDRAFLSSIDDDKRSRTVLSSVVRMANALDIPVIAEGVETKKQQLFLQDIGCDYIQGFLYAKPMPVESYEKKYL